jgi:hypothetical protein
MAKVNLTPFVGGLPFRWMEAKTASYTCTKEDSGTIFHTAGATAAVTFTLPKISDGPFYFVFINGADVDMTVTAGTADTAITYNDVAADSVAASTSGEKIGATIEVICDGTSLYVLPRAADGLYQTFTVTTA